MSEDIHEHIFGKSEREKAERAAAVKAHLLDVYAHIGVEWGGDPFTAIEALKKNSVFADQKKFMEACGQLTDRYHEGQIALYTKLIREETAETDDAVFSMFSKDIGDPAKQMAEVADGALDVIVVAIGLLYSLGLDPVPLWNEVIRSNMAKRGPDGKVHKREDGKVLKPEGWTPPNLVGLIKQQMEGSV